MTAQLPNKRLTQHLTGGTAAQNKGGMFVENGVLFHRYEVCGYPVSQLCVPHGRRLQVLRMAHDLVTSIHL